MRKYSAIMLALFVAVGLSLTATTAFAQGSYNQRTYFTFNGPVALPGITLPANTYLFRVADTGAPHVIQVLSKDGQTLYATFLTIPAQRLTPASKPEVKFRETPAKYPQAIEAWWYPGYVVGHEFLYSPRPMTVATADGAAGAAR